MVKIMLVECCRIWPVVVGYGWRRCGVCKTRPVAIERPIRPRSVA